MLKCKLSTQGGRPQIAKSLSKSEGGSQITILCLNSCEQVFEMRRRWQVLLASQCLRKSIMSPIKRSVEDRTWISFRLKWLFCSDCRPRLFNPLIRLFVVAAPDGDKLMLLAAAAILLLAPPIDPKLVSILIRGVNLDIYSLDTFIRGRTCSTHCLN